MFEGQKDLKKAYYHLMKLEMKMNKKLRVINCSKENAKLSRLYESGEAFTSSVIYVADGELCVSREFFLLSGKDQEVLVNYLSQYCDDIDE